jgi:hypothetical protein
MLMEVVKCVLSDTLVTKCTQYVVQTYALAVIFFSRIHLGLD